jgi:hypothetical protein
MKEAGKSSKLPFRVDGESGTRRGRANGKSSPAEKEFRRSISPEEQRVRLS